MSAISENVMKAAAEAHAEFAKSSVGDNLTTIIARAIAKAVEDERLRFEGDLDKWMKIIGAGITGFQPEAYAVMDSACAELLNLRLEKEALAELQTDADLAKPYGFIVELRTIRVPHKKAIARSRVQPYLQVAEACVEHWKKIYPEDHWRFEIVTLYAESNTAPAVAVKALKFYAEYFDKDSLGDSARDVLSILAARAQGVVERKGKQDEQ